MKQSYLPTPSEVALMTVLLVKRYSEERGKEITRFRLARKSVRRMSIRSQLRDVFIADWTDILSVRYGWVTCPSGDEFLFVEESTTDSWVRLGTNRLDDIIKQLRRGNGSIFDDLGDELDEDPEIADED